MEDSIDVQQDATTGGTQQVNISDKMLHDIQLLISHLANKAPQLIGNPVYQIVAEKSKQKMANDRKRKSTPEAKERRRKSKYSKEDNSVSALKAYNQHDGIEPKEVMEKLKAYFMATEQLCMALRKKQKLGMIM